VITRQTGNLSCIFKWEVEFLDTNNRPSYLSVRNKRGVTAAEIETSKYH
jgi:hypothetical protein